MRIGMAFLLLYWFLGAGMGCYGYGDLALHPDQVHTPCRIGIVPRRFCIARTKTVYIIFRNSRYHAQVSHLFLVYEERFTT
jgi:hypothetical protein